MEKNQEEFEFEEYYDELQKKHNLPDFVALAQDFDIEKIAESVEKKLRNAVEKYPEKDEVALLYSFILLINKSDSKKVELGYRHLKRAFDKLETEKLAYNLVRVGLRIGKLKEGQIMKIIDHVSHRQDTKTLGKLNNMLLYLYMKNGDFDKAVDYVEELKTFNFDLTKISPVIKFIIFLKQGSYEMIATDVAPYDTKKEVEEGVKEVTAGVMKEVFEEEILLESSFENLGVDSLGFLELGGDIEEKFGFVFRKVKSLGCLGLIVKFL